MCTPVSSLDSLPAMWPPRLWWSRQLAAWRAACCRDGEGHSLTRAGLFFFFFNWQKRLYFKTKHSFFSQSVPKRRKGRKNLKGNLKNTVTKYFLKKFSSCLKWKFGVDILLRLWLCESVLIQNKELLANWSISCSGHCTWHSWTL